MPAEQKITRKLRAILSADVKGYHLMMANDEANTVKRLDRGYNPIDAIWSVVKTDGADAPQMNRVFCTTVQEALSNPYSSQRFHLPRSKDSGNR